MLTKDDLSKIQLLIVAGSSLVVREIDKVKDSIQEVKDKIRLIPTKDEYFGSMDKLMGEVMKSREEQTVIGKELSDHSDRLDKLEQKVGVSFPT